MRCRRSPAGSRRGRAIRPAASWSRSPASLPSIGKPTRLVSPNAPRVGPEIPPSRLSRPSRDVPEGSRKASRRRSGGRGARHGRSGASVRNRKRSNSDGTDFASRPSKTGRTARRSAVSLAGPRQAHGDHQPLVRSAH
ncbi:hypothetical protein FHU30_009012 [Actinomadura rupiterrae]|nr:hypothetical protein [Actinomadura rupiterrae]